jgi:hypothetical protein
MDAPFSRRDTLLAYNAGIWEGSFIRLNGAGLEKERFASHLAVEETDGVIEAALTNLSAGTVRAMRFEEPPVEMQIMAQGHWSLGPDRVGPWPWVSELCLVWGDQRRRAVIRHNSSGLESLVLVIEGRPQLSPAALDVPPAPLQLRSSPLGPQQRWSWGNLEVITQATRPAGPGMEAVALRWQPAEGIQLEIERRYGPSGLLEPLLG